MTNTLYVVGPIPNGSGADLTTRRHGMTFTFDTFDMALTCAMVYRRTGHRATINEAEFTLVFEVHVS